MLLGQTVELPPEAEEVAGFYGAMIDTEHAKDATFNKNFFDDFLKILKKYPPVRAICNVVCVNIFMVSSRVTASRSPSSSSAILDRCSTTSKPRRPRRNQ